MNIVQLYFDAFNKKDIKTLSNLYSDDVILSEWDENIFRGKDEVIKANTDLFSKFKNVSITVNVQCEHRYTSFNEIVVKLDDLSLKIVDVITIKDEKIHHIMAYRGF